jgi:2-acylglycerol O-acyltransferase 2
MPLAKMEFAPLSVPFPRRMQTASIVLWLMLYPTMIALFLYLASFNMLFYFAIAYLIFVYLDPAPEMGGRKMMFVRKWTIWKLMRDYFPVKLVKSCDLDPSKNYVFGYHPHGKSNL